MEGVLYASKEYGMIPAENIRGRVHIVIADASMDLLGDHMERTKEVGLLHDGNSAWTTQTFYMNKFYLNQDTIYHSDEIEEN